ncbi:MAG TPA: hypothetical protein ENI97_09285 [Gammaproteobacteria bacterium]|nr:hypothetical protein [Gammaproteobacteria bacterium]
MDKTVVIHPQKSSGHFLLTSILLFISFFLIGLLAMTLLNGGMVNHLLFPLGAELDMFRLIWPQQPMVALELLVTNSLFVFAHQDPRSGLKLWTLDYDAITLAVYLLAALLGGRLIDCARQHQNHRGLSSGLLGMSLLVLAFTYMTAIAHCAGPTWVGFVALYGLGFSGFEFYPYYQAVVATAGLGLLLWGLRRQTQTNR